MISSAGPWAGDPSDKTRCIPSSQVPSRGRISTSTVLSLVSKWLAGAGPGKKNVEERTSSW